MGAIHPMLFTGVLWKDTILWKFHYFLNEIRSLSSLFQLAFKHINRSAHVLAESLAEQGADRDVPFVAS